MKKTFAALICTLTFASCLFAINIGDSKTELKTIPESFPYELKKIILLEYAQNVHRYICEKNGSQRATFASQIIYNVSLVNTELYKNLDKERNDPITARIIMTNIKNSFTNCYWEAYIAKKLSFPGAKKCLELSSQLYDENLTVDKLQQLFTNGAIIDYSVTHDIDSIHKKQSPLMHWCCISRPNKAQSNAIMAKLLDLSANPSLWGVLEGVLEYVISARNDADLTKIILKYNPRITHSVWHSALSDNRTQEYIDLLIACATPDEVTDGLFTCIFPLHYDNKYINYQPKIMKQFINNGANHNIVLDRLTSKIKDINCPVNADNIFVQNFNFLCEQKAFDVTALKSMRNLQKLFGDLADAVESNQPFKTTNQ